MTNNVADELEIRQLVALYADAVNRVDKDQWAGTWAEDSAWSLPGLGDVSGKEAIVNLWEQAMGGFEFVAQLVYHGTLFIDGDTGTGRWYLSEHLRPAGTTEGVFNIGSYADEYQRCDGRWLFARRNYSVLYNDEGKGDMSGTVTPLS